MPDLQLPARAASGAWAQQPDPLSSGPGGIAEMAAMIRAARDVEEMAAVRTNIQATVEGLLGVQAPSEYVTGVITTLNDHVTQRLVEMLDGNGALRRAGGCWVALGSQGRCEQTLATDQDNGIVFADDGDPGVCRRALLPLARQVNEALDRCGFPLCRGEVMASNPKWCLSLSEWRQRFAGWIEVPEPQALLNASIFFDFRPVYGDRTAVLELRRWLAEFAEDRGRFLLAMVLNALQHRPPLGLFRNFILERGGNHRGSIDLKVNGVQLFVESARVYSLASGVTATNTLERIAALADRRRIPATELAAWSDAFRFIQLNRLKLNAAQRARGEPFHNHLDPAALDENTRRMLRKALLQARKVQSRLARDFSLPSAGFGG